YDGVDIQSLKLIGRDLADRFRPGPSSPSEAPRGALRRRGKQVFVLAPAESGAPAAVDVPEKDFHRATPDRPTPRSRPVRVARRRTASTTCSGLTELRQG